MWERSERAGEVVRERADGFALVTLRETVTGEWAVTRDRLAQSPDSPAYRRETVDSRPAAPSLVESRAEEIERAFRDPEIRAAVATIGGNDQIRVLNHLDRSVLREHPTRFFGTSDNSSLAAFLREAGVVSFYGGTLYTDVAAPGDLGAFAREYLRRGFFADALGTVRPAERFSDQDLDWNDPANLERDPEYEPTARRWFPGDGSERVTGRTWGGCLSVLNTHFVADRCLPADPSGTVLLLETSEVMPSADEVRRNLIGMGERGYLDVGAVLVGRAKARSHAADRPAAERSAYRERQREAVVETMQAYSDAVVVTDCSFGHTRPVAPLPIGGRAVVDAGSRELRFPGPA
jgi:muramoyltetrapeptide carboxypeptidase LdcA involved in peptidoglycan recycling